VTIISIFFIVLIVTFAVLALATKPSKTEKQIDARLVSLDRATPSSFSSQEPGIVKEVTFSTIPALDRFLRQNRAAVALQVLIEQSGLKWTVGGVVFGTLVLMCAGALLGSWWFSSGLWGGILGLALGTLPYVFLWQKRNRRTRRFTEQLPQAIDLMARGLRAGQALPAAVEIVAQECDDPLRTEFRRAADEQSFGLPFREAMLNLARRSAVRDLQFLVTAILVQRETGGNLAKILDKASHVIRERTRVAGQVRIRTAQGRFTGWVLTGLPFVVFIGMNFLHPGYGKVLFEDPRGRLWVEIAAVGMAVGVIAIRRIVNFKF